MFDINGRCSSASCRLDELVRKLVARTSRAGGLINQVRQVKRSPVTMKSSRHKVNMSHFRLVGRVLRAYEHRHQPDQLT
jgi:hypothetical protein